MNETKFSMKGAVGSCAEFEVAVIVSFVEQFSWAVRLFFSGENHFTIWLLYGQEQCDAEDIFLDVVSSLNFTRTCKPLFRFRN